MKIDGLSAIIVLDQSEKATADKIRKSLTALFRAAGVDASMSTKQDKASGKYQLTITINPEW